jgi:hypothetical protein
MPASKLVRALLQRIDRCNSDCIAETGDIDPEKVAKLIEEALEDPRHRHTLILGLSTYIAHSMVGVVPDISL